MFSIQMFGKKILGYEKEKILSFSLLPIFPIQFPSHSKAWNCHATWTSRSPQSLQMESHFAMGGTRTPREMEILLPYLKKSRFQHITFSEGSLVGHEKWVRDFFRDLPLRTQEVSLRARASQFNPKLSAWSIKNPSIYQIIQFFGSLSFVSSRSEKMEMTHLSLVNPKINAHLAKEMCRINGVVSFDLNLKYKKSLSDC